MKRISRILAGLLILSLAVPAIAEVSGQDLDRAREEIDRIVAESQALGDAVQEAWARQAELEYEISQLQTSIEFAQVQIAQTEGRLEEVAVELYMGSTAAASLSMLFSARSDEVGAGFQYLRDVSGVDSSVITQLRAFRRELDRQTKRLAEASAEEESLTVELQQMAAQLLEELGKAQQYYDQLLEQQRQEEEAARRAAEEAARRAAEEAARRAAEEAARRAAEEAARHATTTTTTTTTVVATTTTLSRTTTTVGEEPTTTVPLTTTTTLAPSSGAGACPVAGPVSFTDSWGAPRSGGRTHKGVDMINARGTPIVAIFDVVIARISVNNLGGNTLWLRADNGDEFYYAHMDSYGNISVGQRVPAGYVVGYNGSSGNSPDWIPHLHLEWHPNGGGAVNPYPLVKDLCG